MKKNVASQLVSAQMISTTDGSDVTSGTCNVAVEIDGVAGTGGTATHIANGKWEYAPIQGDTNGDYLTFQFVLSGAVTQTVQIYTTFPQTGDNFARLGAPAGASVSADIADVPTVSEFNARTQPTADYFDPAADTVANVTTVATTTNLTNLPSIPANWITTAGITDGAFTAAKFAASSLDGKGDWNVGKTGYSLTATTGLGNQTANITGNLSGSVGSVVGHTAQTGDTYALANGASGFVAIDTVVDNLNLGIIYGAAATGTLSTTQATTDLTGYADDQLIGRVIIWTSGACEGEATDITDYANASGLLTFTALTTAPSNSDTFKIV